MNIFRLKLTKFDVIEKGGAARVIDDGESMKETYLGDLGEYILVGG